MIKRILVIGVGEYKNDNLRELGGPENDVGKVLKTLQYEKRTTLYNSTAEKDNILEKTHWLIDDANPGDAFVFYFSGHGSTVPSSSEEDGYDEVLCPYDFDPDNGLFIRDDDLATIFDSIRPGVILDVILDCCFSGGMDRAAISIKPEEKWATAKFLPATIGKREKQRKATLKINRFLKEKRGARGAADAVSLRYALWCASQEGQKAFEDDVDGKTYGLFTYHTCRELTNSNTGTSRKELLNRVIPCLKRQTPILYGNQTIKDSSTFILISSA